MITIKQPHMVDQLMKNLRLEDNNVNIRQVPAKSSSKLSRDLQAQPFDKSFDYRSVVGKLNYLEKATRPDISYIVHQCARFTSEPRKEHGEAIRWLGRYLKGTRDQGIILNPSKGKGLEMFVDADFAGNWNKYDTWDCDTARLQHGYVIMYDGCPITWKS